MWLVVVEKVGAGKMKAADVVRGIASISADRRNGQSGSTMKSSISTDTPCCR